MPTDEKTISMTFEFDAADQDGLTVDLKSRPVTVIQETKEKRSEPGKLLETVIAIIAVTAATAVIANYIIEKFRGGTLIDATQKPIKTTRDRNIPGGNIIVIASNDVKVEYQNVTEVKLKEILDALVNGQPLPKPESA
jgi:hypothetical protein